VAEISKGGVPPVRFAAALALQARRLAFLGGPFAHGVLRFAVVG
jgi:hypothetical protein